MNDLHLIEEKIKTPSKFRFVKAVFVKSSVVYYSIKRTNKFNHLETILFLFSNKGKKLISKFFKYLVHSFTINRDSFVKQTIAYNKWLKTHLPSEKEIEKYGLEVANMAEKPLFSIILPSYNTSSLFLTWTIESVLTQVYKNWELIIVDDNSNKDYTKNTLKHFQKKDSRIKIIYRATQGLVTEAINDGLQIANGEYVCFLNHEDMISKDALYQFAKCIVEKKNIDIAYCDEDKIDEKNTHLSPIFKTEWRPHSLLSRNYIGHFFMIRKSLVDQIGFMKTKYLGSHDYDLLLRASIKARKIWHVPRILYHWRITNSLYSNIYGNFYAFNAGKRALESYLNRLNIKGSVEMHDDELIGTYTIRYQLKKYAKVSIIIPSKNKAHLLKQCIDSILEASTYSNFEILVVDNASNEESFENLMQEYKSVLQDRFKVILVNRKFNFSELINKGSKEANGEYLLLLNNDTKVVSPTWIEDMMCYAQNSNVGAVGVQLLFPDNSIQHCGIEFDNDLQPYHLFSHEKLEKENILANTINNFQALTGACLMVSKTKFEEVNGFNERLAVEFNDIDFCMKLRQKKWHNVYLNHVKLYHYESVSRGRADQNQENYSRYTLEKGIFLSQHQERVKSNVFLQ